MSVELGCHGVTVTWRLSRCHGEREREEAEMEAWSWAAGGCHGEREAAEMGNGKLGKRNVKFSIYT